MIEESILNLDKSIELSSEPESLSPGTYKSVLHYISGNFTEHFKSFYECQNIVQYKEEKEYRNPAIYWNYLFKLHLWFKENNENQKDIQVTDRLYVIGESHSLSPHRVKIEFLDNYYLGKTEWILGIKQWHLANKDKNEYKHKFNSIINRLPQHSTILLTIGEIDCRPNEGIWSVAREKSLEVNDVINTTINGYIDYIKSSLNNHTVIVQGVPAPNYDISEEKLEGDKEEFLNMIKTFNTKLEKLSLESGFYFFDVYSATVDNNSTSNKKFHIDSHHLNPDIYKEFNKWLIKPKAKQQPKPTTIDFSKYQTVSLSKPS